MNKIQNLRISIIRKQRTSRKGVKFNTYITRMLLPMIDENGVKTEKPCEVWVQVKFSKEVDTSVIKSGTIVVPSNKVFAPSIYKVELRKEEFPNGMIVENKVYPCVWINQVNDFIPYKGKQVTQQSFIIEEDEAENNLDDYAIPDEVE